MKRILCSGLVILILLFTACTSARTPAESTIAELKPVTLDNLTIVAGQTIYVPIYAQIYTWAQNRTVDLTATLSVRNTDAAHPLMLAAVNYYDNNGKLARNYLEQPVELGPLSATSFVVGQSDVTGGSGASFVVEWVSPTALTAPVIEAIMINTNGNQGISFVSSGRVIQSRTAEQSDSSMKQ